ncbi:hypothetical protein GOBAR_DD32232 [Gossypium barbadense]|nr:hypothetical protein GOBAR_DD32232 [Gossypium barbadense]
MGEKNNWIPGDVARVDGQLAVARAFGDKSLKKHLTSEPDDARSAAKNLTEEAVKRNNKDDISINIVVKF